MNNAGKQHTQLIEISRLAAPIVSCMMTPPGQLGMHVRISYIDKTQDSDEDSVVVFSGPRWWAVLVAGLGRKWRHRFRALVAMLRSCHYGFYVVGWSSPAGGSATVSTRYLHLIRGVGHSKRVQCDMLTTCEIAEDRDCRAGKSLRFNYRHDLL